MESVVPEYDGLGLVREASGSTLTGIVPSNIYPTADGKTIIIGANTNPMFTRLCELMDKPNDSRTLAKPSVQSRSLRRTD